MVSLTDAGERGKEETFHFIENKARMRGKQKRSQVILSERNLCCTLYNDMLSFSAIIHSGSSSKSISQPFLRQFNVKAKRIEKCEFHFGSSVIEREAVIDGVNGNTLSFIQ